MTRFHRSFTAAEYALQEAHALSRAHSQPYYVMQHRHRYAVLTWEQLQAHRPAEYIEVRYCND